MVLNQVCDGDGFVFNVLGGVIFGLYGAWIVTANIVLDCTLFGSPSKIYMYSNIRLAYAF